MEYPIFHTEEDIRYIYFNNEVYINISDYYNWIDQYIPTEVDIAIDINEELYSPLNTLPKGHRSYEDLTNFYYNFI